MNIIKIISKIILGVFLTLIISGILVVALFFSVNGKEQRNQENIVNSDREERVLILYQDSRMGNTKRVVDVAVQTFKDYGYTVVSNHPREDTAYDLEDYSVIVLASPVYAGQISEALLEYAGKQDFTGKKVLVLLTGSDLNQTAEIENIKANIHNAKEIQSIKVDKADNRVSDKVKELIKNE